MANLQTYYVDLSLSNTVVGSGTATDKYSWGDVIRWFATLNASPFDTPNDLDGNVPFDMTGVSVEFRMTGRRVMALSDILLLSNLDFFLGAFIRFTSDDPANNGVPVWQFASGTTISTFLSIVGGSAANIKIQGALIDVEGALGTLVSSNSDNGKITLENNVIVARTKTSLINSASNYGAITFAGNTVIVGSIADGQHVLITSTGATTSIAVSHNIVGQHASSGSALVGLSAVSSNTLLASGNVWAIRSNGSAYSGIYPSASSSAPDVFGQNLLDVVYGDTTFGGTTVDFTTLLSADTNMARGCSEFTLTFARAKHGGPAVGLIAGQAVTVTTTDAVGYIDITGKYRPGILDAGALQKSGLTVASSVYVNLNLAQSRTNALGTSTDPITSTDWLLDLITRAPVDNTVQYLLSGHMSTSATTLDIILGTGSDYTGAGKISIVGWKTYNRSLPTLRINSVYFNQTIETAFQKVQVEWTGSQDFLTCPSSGLNANAVTCSLLNMTLRSNSANTGRFVALTNNSPILQIGGLSAALKHSTATTQASGYIAINSALPHVFALSAFETGNQALLMTVPAQATVTGLYVHSQAGTATIAGPTASYTVLTGIEPFQDTTSDTPDFTLISTTVAVSILSDASLLPTSVKTILATDCRDLERSAYPYGTTALDAGAYEYGYKIYPEIHLYVDLSKTSTGHVGTIIDKFSYADLVSWVTSLKSATLSKRYVVHLLRRLESDTTLIDLSNLEGNPYLGNITFVTDNGKSAATLISTRAPTITAYNTQGLTLEFRKVVLSSSSGYGPIAVSGKDTTTNTLTLKNSIVSWLHSQVGFTVTRTGTLSGTDSITINTTTFTQTQTTSSSGDDFDALLSSIQADSTIGSIVTVTAVVSGSIYRISPATSVDITVNSSANITSTRCVNLIDGDTNWTAKIGACSIADSFTKDLALQTQVVGNAPVDFVATAVQSIVSGASKIGTIATSTTNVYGLAYSSVATLGTVSGTTINARPTTSALFANAADADFDQDSYKLTGNVDTLSILNGSQLPTWASTLNVDMLGSLRFATTSSAMDAGAIEYNGISSTGTYDPTTAAPIVTRTAAGQAALMRAEAEGPLSIANTYASGARALNPFAYKIVGYQLLNEGYIYWQPTQPTDIVDFSGTQASATITIAAGNSFDATTVITVAYLGRTAALTYTAATGNTGIFSAGTTAAETANNVATLLRSTVLNGLPLESVLWISVTGNVITLTAKLIGSYGNLITVTTTGTGVNSTSMANGTDATTPSSLVYPTSGWIAFDKTEIPDPYSVSFLLKLGVSDANVAFGAIAVMAEIISSPLATEVGTVIPFAIVRMPLESKHERKTISCRVLFT